MVDTPIGLWVLLICELLLFAFATGISIYELTISDLIGNVYRGTHFYHIFATFMVLYMFVDKRRKTTGVLIAFCLIFVIDFLNAVKITLHLPKTMYSAWLLEMISAWLHPIMTTIIIIWYIYDMRKKTYRQL